MLFHSLAFLFVFLPVTWILFTLLLKYSRANVALSWLTLASLFFYGYWNPPYVALIISSVLVNFFLGRKLSPDNTSSASVRKAFLVLGLVFNLGLLGYFKYANFFVDNLNAIFGSGYNLEKVILPLAISFFTFQQVAYLVDVFKGHAHQYKFLEYSFFVTFFPQLIAGPIVLHSEVMPQVRAERFKKVRLLNLQVGLTIFIIGLFKKMVIADTAATYATPFFEMVADGSTLSTIHAWTASLAYTIQLYFDFSGYSDMAIGIGRCFGLVLPLNFAAPYKATSIVDFWRRWHITLSRFLRDYLYIPLGGNRKGLMIRHSNLMITMLLGGLWHGAGWNFVIWGGLHGAYLIVNHSFSSIAGPSLKARPKLNTVLKPLFWALTMLCVIISWVFFRAADWESASRMIGMMFGIGNETATPLSSKMLMAFPPDNLPTPLWFFIILAIVLPTTQTYMRRYTPALGLAKKRRFRLLKSWRPTIAHGLLIGFLCFFILRRYFQLTPTEFLYFNF